MQGTFSDQTIKSTGVLGFILGVAVLIWFFDLVAMWITGYPTIYCATSSAWRGIGLVQIVVWVGVIGFAVKYVTHNPWLLKQAVGYGVIVFLLPIIGGALFSHGSRCGVASTGMAQYAPVPPPVAPPPAPASPVVEQAQAPSTPAPVAAEPPPAAPKYALGPYGMPLHTGLGPVDPDADLYIGSAAYQLQMPTAVLHAWMKARRINYTYPTGYNPDEFDEFTDRSFHIAGMEMLRFMRKYCNEPDAPPLWRCHSLTDEVPPPSSPAPAKTAEAPAAPSAPPVPVTPALSKEGTAPKKPKVERLPKKALIDGAHPYSIRQGADLLQTNSGALLRAIKKWHIVTIDKDGNHEAQPKAGSRVFGADLMEVLLQCPDPPKGRESEDWRCHSLR